MKMAELKALAEQLGIIPDGDKRCKQTWIDAIAVGGGMSHDAGLAVENDDGAPHVAGAETDSEEDSDFSYDLPEEDDDEASDEYVYVAGEQESGDEASEDHSSVRACDGKDKVLQAAEAAARILAGDETSLFLRHVDLKAMCSAEELNECSKPVEQCVSVPEIPNKIVVFSTYHDTLDAAQKVFSRVCGVDCSLRIDGKTAHDARAAIIKRFGTPESPPFLFCQTDAGGCGINLQTANVAFILDPKWSPALERQAQDRIWRLRSPHKAVYFYNFLTKDTVDEVYKAAQDRKSKLHEQTIAIIEDCVENLGETRTTKSKAAADAEHLASELKNCGFDGTLYPHQVPGIRWMQRQECGKNPSALGVKGGIQADDMGLGKTVQCLATISLDRSPMPTLVVCPKSVFSSWQEDCKLRFPNLRVHVWHGKHGKWTAERIDQHASADPEQPLLILTNYHAMRDYSEELLKVQWRRLVLDESHAINDRKNGFDVACRLEAEIKWSVSGTPMKNKLKDFDAHLELIGASGQYKCDDMKTQSALLGVALRRTKVGQSSASSGLSLPTCFRNVYEWREMDIREQEQYMDALAQTSGLGKFAVGTRQNGIYKRGETQEDPYASPKRSTAVLAPSTPLRLDKPAERKPAPRTE